MLNLYALQDGSGFRHCYKGVERQLDQSGRLCFRARARIAGKVVPLGACYSEVIAALRYDSGVRALRPGVDTNTLNFPTHTAIQEVRKQTTGHCIPCTAQVCIRGMGLDKFMQKVILNKLVIARCTAMSSIGRQET